MNWKNKFVMVTGGDGMIGQELVKQLEKEEANVIVVDVKRGKGHDLREYSNCLSWLESIRPEFIFHLAGIKGNIWKTQNEPVDFMGPMLQFNTNMIIAAQECGIKNFLYTSSIAVEQLETDAYPGWAKLTGEKLIEAMKIQYPIKYAISGHLDEPNYKPTSWEGTKWVIVRPANVYGRFDDYKNPEKRGMVISSLIHKALNNDYLEVWGDGNDIRDFINSKDVARGMILAMEQMPQSPVNLCSGEEVLIKDLALIIAKATGRNIRFDESKPKGAIRRVMKINWDFKPMIGLDEGIRDCVAYARN